MFLVKRGFVILKRNYLRRCGEIDIVAEKDTKIHFVEVKTIFSSEVSCETYQLKQMRGIVCAPENNICFSKVNKIIKTANLFLAENNLKDKELQIDAVSVIVGLDKKWLHIKYIENINIF